jgi:hypothetical protein
MERRERGAGLAASAFGAWAVLLGVLAMPASATVSCPTPKSSSCQPVLPIAVTTDATGTEPTSDVESTAAILNGVAGPGVSNGDITQYHFQWGTSKAYGTNTRTGTIGSCPPGVPSGSPYCAVPPAQYVHFAITKLIPCTGYHFRIVASNATGSSAGLDRTFSTEFLNPIKVFQAPKRIRNHTRFRVTVAVVTTVRITIQLRFRGKTVKTFEKSARTGELSQPILAPEKIGKYTIKVVASESCGQRTITKKLTVT